MVTAVSRKLFGVGYADIVDFYPDDPPGTKYELDYKAIGDYLAGETPPMIEIDDDTEYETLEVSHHMSDDELVEQMLKIGIDFRDERGHPLRCTKFMAGPAEAAHRGFAGKIPQQEDLGVDRFATKMQREAAEFLARKRRG